VRGDGRVYQRKGSAIWWCAYYQRGKEIRESTGETSEKKALKFLQKRVREVENDRDGIKTFTGPRAERIKIACGIADPVVRKQSQCDCLICALERHLLLGGDKKKNLPVDGKLSRGENGILMRLHRDFAGELATSLTAGDVDPYIEGLLCDEEYAKASVNRIMQKLGQAYNLAIRQNRLPSDKKPHIRKLSEKDDVRQGFFERPEFLLVKAALPEYLQDFAHFRLCHRHAVWRD
jgi:hypothetical protein